MLKNVQVLVGDNPEQLVDLVQHHPVLASDITQAFTMRSLVLDQQCVTIRRSDSAESHTATLADHNHADVFRHAYPSRPVASKGLGIGAGV